MLAIAHYLTAPCCSPHRYQALVMTEIIGRRGRRAQLGRLRLLGCHLHQPR